MVTNNLQTQNLGTPPTDQTFVTGQPNSRMSDPLRRWLIAVQNKINVINAYLATWAGINPVSGVTPGTYGSTTSYPIITVNEYGQVINASNQSVSAGGNPININEQTGSYILQLTDIPANSSYRGFVSVNSASPNTITIPTHTSVAFPNGAILYASQFGAGATTIQGASGVTFFAPTITGGGQYSTGMAIQLTQDTWLISGNLAYSAYVNSTWNPSDKNANITLSNGNLTATPGGSLSGYGMVRATNSHNSGKLYFEVKCNTSAGPNYAQIGIAPSSSSLSEYPGYDSVSYGYYQQNGDKYNNATGVAFGSSYTAGDIIGVAVDLTNGYVWFAKNNTWQASGNPSGGTNPAYSGLSGSYFPALGVYQSGSNFTGNFTSAEQSYSPPTGFSSWN